MNAKKIILRTMCSIAVACMAVSAFAEGNALSLADARGKIESVINNPSEVTSIVKQLPAADQIAFVSSLNEAIANLPGSVEERSAAFVNAGRAALKGAAKGNAPAMVAEIFATVPPESLTMVNEVFAKEVVSRTADPSKTYSDEQFTEIAKNLMEKVTNRDKSADNSGVRDAFAAIMLVRASNGTPENLPELLSDLIPDKEAAAYAKNEWIADALGKGDSGKPNYDGILGYANAGDAPDASLVIRIVGIQESDVLLDQFMSGGDTGIRYTTDGFGDIAEERIGDDAQLSRVPRTIDPGSKANPKYRRGTNPVVPPTPEQPVEPRPYRYQVIHL